MRPPTEKSNWFQKLYCECVHFDFQQFQAGQNATRAGNNAQQWTSTQGWNPVQQAPTAPQPSQQRGDNNNNNNNLPPAMVSEMLAAQHSNPLQPVMDSITLSEHSGQPGQAASGAAFTGQCSNQAEPAPASAAQPPHGGGQSQTQTSMMPQPACTNNNNNTTPQAPPPPSTDAAATQAHQSFNAGQHGLNPQQPHPQAPPPPVATERFGSSVATRFAIAAQGASSHSKPRRQHLQFNPYVSCFNPLSNFTWGYMTISIPSSTDYYPSQTTYVHATGPQTPYDPAAAEVANEAMLLPMYTGSSFRDLVRMAQHEQNLSRRKQEEEGGPGAKNPRGRPRGSRKRRPPVPQWVDEGEYPDVEPSGKRPYQRRQAEWSSMRMAGAIPEGGPLGSFTGEMAAANDGRGGDEGQSGVGASVGTTTTPMTPNPNQNPSQAETIQTQNLPEPVPQPAAQLVDASANSGLLQPEGNHHKLWSFEAHPPAAGQSTGDGYNAGFKPADQPPSRAAAAVSKGKQPMEAETEIPIQAGNLSGDQIAEKLNSFNDQSMVDFGGVPTLPFPNPGGYDVSMEPVANQTSNPGGYLQDFIDFTDPPMLHNPPPVLTQTGMVAEADNYDDPSTDITPSFQTTASASSDTLQDISNDLFDLSVSDYFLDLDPMQLAEEYNAGAAWDKIFEQPENSNNVNMTAQPETQPAAAPSTHQPVATTQVEQPVLYACSHQPIATTRVEQPVLTFGDFQTNSFGQLAERTNSKMKAPCVANVSSSNEANNLQPAAPLVAPQPLQNSPVPNAAQDGSSTVHQTFTQNLTFENNIPAAAAAAAPQQGSAPPQVPGNANHQAASGSQYTDYSLGPTAYYYQNRQQQQPNPYNMPPQPVQHSRPPGPQPRLVMQQQYYPYSRRGSRRRRHNAPPAPSSVMDFNHCAVTPAMFNNMVYDGSVNSITESDLWPGMQQDVYNMMVLADPTLPLQQRVAQMNLGMAPVPNQPPAMRMQPMYPQQTVFSVPPVANNRMMGNGGMTNYGDPGMETYQTPQQGYGAAADAAYYNVGGPQTMMNPNNIPSYQNQPPQNMQGQMNAGMQYWPPSYGNWPPEYPAGPSCRRPEEVQGQMNANMQQWHPSYGNWPEYPASSSRRPEEMQQPVAMNPPPTAITSAQDNMSYNHQFPVSRTAAAPMMPAGSFHRPPQQQQATAAAPPPANPQHGFYSRLTSISSFSSFSFLTKTIDKA
uniref:Uncharacterized protein n=1 Tax=Kalanchoe fedtschenkoi TaxID=63787 RepID=A0A7N1A3S0_KALFE